MIKTELQVLRKLNVELQILGVRSPCDSELDKKSLTRNMPGVDFMKDFNWKGGSKIGEEEGLEIFECITDRT